MNLTARHPAPFGAVITPTRSTDLLSRLQRLIAPVGTAWATWKAPRRRADDPMDIDAATLRDLGISHAAALAEGVDAFAERRPRGRRW